MLTVLLQASANIQNVPQFLVSLEKFGLMDAVLPFILIFAIIFTVVNRTRVLGEQKNVHMLVALVISLLVVIPHVLGTYPPGSDVVNIINGALPNVSLLIVIVVAALILIGIFRPNSQGIPGGGFFAILALGAVVYIFGLSAGWWTGTGPLNFLANPDFQVVIVIILVFAVVMFMITSESPGEGIFKGIRGLFNK